MKEQLVWNHAGVEGRGRSENTWFSLVGREPAVRLDIRAPTRGAGS